VVTDRPWARHYQEAWARRAGDDRMPYWLRIVALAYGSHADNGHARFKRGELALILGSIDRETGVIHPYAHAARAIRDAVDYGWLEPESFWGCLVVPAHAIKKGPYGHEPVCPIHVKRRRRGVETATERRLRLVSPTSDGGFARRSRHSVAGSQREPLSSFSHQSRAPRDAPHTEPAGTDEQQGVADQ
jgi:hypothetical protein